ncbi:MAG: electron transfer flavoprotein subunit beta/FixA family protein [Sulfolobales archaeon]
MNIVVLVKLAIDTGQLRFDPSTYKPLIEDIPLKISDIDRNAIEEAQRLRSLGFSKVYSLTVLTWGPLNKRVQEAQSLLREVLALGVDESILIADESTISAESSYTAKIIANAIKKIGNVNLVLAGEASIDKFTSQIPARVAAELNYSYTGFVRKIDVKEGRIIAERDLENYTEIVELRMPAVIAVTREINTPRLPTLLQIRSAMKKPLTIYKTTDLGVEMPKKLVEVSYEGIRVSRKNIVIEGKDMREKVSKLVEYLVSEGVITLKR